MNDISKAARRILSTMQSSLSALSYGVFFGNEAVQKELPGFSVSLLSPVLRAEDMPLHAHDHASFILPLVGPYFSTADGAPAVCSAETLIFNPAGTVHRDSFELAMGRFLAVSMSAETLRVAKDGMILSTSAIIMTSHFAIQTALRLAHLASSQASDPSDMEALCWELISVAGNKPTWSERHRPAWSESARDLLNDRCNQRLQIAEIARELGIHPVYFARGFRRAFGCTPCEYLMRCRMRNVMALVRRTKHSLSDIAVQAGFYDQAHLTKAFRQQFGLTPDAYRRRL